MEGHTKRVTGLEFVSGSVLISSSADKTARIWREGADGGYACAAVLRDHQVRALHAMLCMLCWAAPCQESALSPQMPHSVKLLLLSSHNEYALVTTYSEVRI